MLFGLDQTIAAVVALIDDSDGSCFLIPIDEEAVFQHLHAHDRFIEIHQIRIDRLGADDLILALIVFVAQQFMIDERFCQLGLVLTRQTRFLTADLILQLVDRQIDGRIQVIMYDLRAKDGKLRRNGYFNFLLVRIDTDDDVGRILFRNDKILIQRIQLFFDFFGVTVMFLP